MAEQRVTEAGIRAVLAGTCTPEAVEIWWTAANRNLNNWSPRYVFGQGFERRVLAEAERVAGAM